MLAGEYGNRDLGHRLCFKSLHAYPVSDCVDEANEISCSGDRSTTRVPSEMGKYTLIRPDATKYATFATEPWMKMASPTGRTGW